MRLSDPTGRPFFNHCWNIPCLLVTPSRITRRGKQLQLWLDMPCAPWLLKEHPLQDAYRET